MSPTIDRVISPATCKQSSNPSSRRTDQISPNLTGTPPCLWGGHTAKATTRIGWHRVNCLSASLRTCMESLKRTASLGSNVKARSKKWSKNTRVEALELSKGNSVTGHIPSMRCFAMGSSPLPLIPPSLAKSPSLQCLPSSSKRRGRNGLGMRYERTRTL